MAAPLKDPPKGKPAKRSQREKSLVGPAGEYYVLYRLYHLGLLASLAPRGAPTVDVLVLSPDETVVATLQVKARTRGPDGGWPMSLKHERIVQPRCFYAFVDFEPKLPVTYIVPSKVVADVLARSHQAWLGAPGRGGRAAPGQQDATGISEICLPAERVPGRLAGGVSGALGSAPDSTARRGFVAFESHGGLGGHWVTLPGSVVPAKPRLTRPRLSYIASGSTPFQCPPKSPSPPAEVKRSCAVASAGASPADSSPPRPYL